MALVASLVESTPFRLRYLLTADGEVSSPTNPDLDASVVIPNDVGGATPNLDTDSSAGPLREVVKVRLTGYGPIAAGAITQAQARALFLSDDAASAVLTNDLVGRCVAECQGRTGRLSWAVDAEIDGQGDPVLRARCTAGVAGTGYVDLHFRHTFDL